MSRKQKRGIYGLNTVRSRAAAARAFLRGTAVDRRGATAKAARRSEEMDRIVKNINKETRGHAVVEPKGEGMNVEGSAQGRRSKGRSERQAKV